MKVSYFIPSYLPQGSRASQGGGTPHKHVLGVKLIFFGQNIAKSVILSADKTETMFMIFLKAKIVILIFLSSMEARQTSCIVLGYFKFM